MSPPVPQSVSAVFTPGATLLCCFRWKRGHNVSSLTADPGPCRIQLVSQPLPVIFYVLLLRGHWQSALLAAGATEVVSSFRRNPRPSGRKRILKWSACHLGTELHSLTGPSHCLLLLSWLVLVKEFVSKWGCECILTWIQLVIIFASFSVFLLGYRTVSAGAQGSLHQLKILMILTKFKWREKFYEPKRVFVAEIVDATLLTV